MRDGGARPEGEALRHRGREAAQEAAAAAAACRVGVGVEMGKSERGGCKLFGSYFFLSSARTGLVLGRGGLLVVAGRGDGRRPVDIDMWEVGDGERVRVSK